MSLFCCFLVGNSTGSKNSKNSNGGGGSGGRIAIYLTSEPQFEGTVQSLGGSGVRHGSSGTVYTKISVGNETKSKLKIDNINRDETYYLTLKVNESRVDELEMRRKAVITLPWVSYPGYRTLFE